MTTAPYRLYFAGTVDVRHRRGVGRRKKLVAVPGTGGRCSRSILRGPCRRFRPMEGGLRLGRQAVRATMTLAKPNIRHRMYFHGAFYDHGGSKAARARAD